MLQQLPPGTANAIVRALGPGGLDRVGQVVSAGNKSSWFSGSTHRASGRVDGHPFGCAFDVLIDPLRNADADTRKLRLQGIAAWHRGPRAPGGPAGIGPHIHCVWPGTPTSNPENLQQIGSFIHGYRGLASKARPRREWRDPTIRADEIAAVTRRYNKGHACRPIMSLVAYDQLHRGTSGG
jgi:hypothetical protein